MLKNDVASLDCSRVFSVFFLMIMLYN